MEKTETINKEEIIYCHHCGTAINSNEKEHLKLFKIKSNKYELCPNCHSLLNFNDKIGMTRFAITSIEKKAKGTIYKSIYNFTFQFFLGKLLSFLTVSTLVFSGYKAITAQVDNNKYLDNDKTVVKDDTKTYVYTISNTSIVQNENIEDSNEQQEIIESDNEQKEIVECDDAAEAIKISKENDDAIVHVDRENLTIVNIEETEKGSTEAIVIVVENPNDVYGEIQEAFLEASTAEEREALSQGRADVSDELN